MAWIVFCGVAATAVHRQGGMVDGEPPDGLVPTQHRISGDRAWLLLTADGGRADPEALLAAADALAHALPGDRIPLAPPQQERTAWNDDHALFLVPLATHDELRRRLDDEALHAAVDSLAARLSSPFFGLLDDDVRRDPLGTQDLAEDFGFAGSGWEHAPEVTAIGDLLAADGRSLLVGLRLREGIGIVTTAATQAVAGLPVSATVLGPRARQHRQAQVLAEQWKDLAWVTLAGLTVAWSMTLRRSRLVLAMLVATMGAGLGLVAAVSAFSVASTPLFAVFLSFVAVFLVQGSTRRDMGDAKSDVPRGAGWGRVTHVLVVALALTPLAWSPYPTWTRWAVVWPIAVCAAVAGTNVVVHVLIDRLKTRWSWPSRGFVLTPMPVAGFLVALAVLAGGAWASASADHRSVHHVPLSDADLGTAEATMARSFFAPAHVAEIRSPGKDSATALERAATDVVALQHMIPLEANRIDSPGSAVVPAPLLTQRRDSLERMDLPARMSALRRILEAKGLRADAFGEFLRKATDLAHPPTAQAALDGPLGPWVQGYATSTADGVTMHSYVDLVAGSESSVTRVQVEGGEPLPLFGPIVAARLDRAGFRNALGGYSIMALTMGALCLWMGNRNLIVALAAVVAAVVTQSAILISIVLFDQAVGAHLLPALLLLSAASMTAAARTLEAIEHRRPHAPTRELLIGACLAAPGIALWTSGEPLWREIGGVFTLGALFSTGVGLFVAPGLGWILRRLGGRKA